MIKNMTNPVSKKLSKSMLDSIEVDKIIYAEVTPPGAMGNSGGIIIYTTQNDSQTNELICYRTNIFEDEETYLLAEKILLKYVDMTFKTNEKEESYFDFYYGGMGNNVLINKKVNLDIQDNFFVYTAENLQFQILSSVQGVFMSIADVYKNRNKPSQLERNRFVFKN
jgi:hypothetical protein